MYSNDSPIEEKTEHHHKTHHHSGSQTSRFLLLAIPFLVILTLLTVAVSLYKKDKITQQYPAEEVRENDDEAEELAQQYLSELQTQEQANVAVPEGYEIVNLSEEEKQRLYGQIRMQAPVNPTQVNARASSDPQAQELQPGAPYSYANPVFTWSGEVVREQGVNVTGYMVYFGRSHFSPDFLNEATFQTSNTYTASNLAPGTTYFLMVRVVTDSNTANLKYGFDQALDGRPVRTLFTYLYR